MCGGLAVLIFSGLKGCGSALNSYTPSSKTYQPYREPSSEYTTCDECIGMGRIHDAKKCDACRGTGKEYDPASASYVNCSKCGGVGKIWYNERPCPNCNGKGKVHVERVY